MSRPAEGLATAVYQAPGAWRLYLEEREAIIRFAATWISDHLEALAETGEVDHGSFRLAAAEARAVGGVE